MSEAIMDLQEQKNQEIALTEPATLEQLKSELGNAYVAMFLALDNLATCDTKENNAEYENKSSAMFAAERKLSRFLYDQRKQSRESVKFEKDPNDKDYNEPESRGPGDQALEDSYK